MRSILPHLARTFAAAGLAAGIAAQAGLEEALARHDFVAAEAELEQLAASWQHAWQAGGKPADGIEYGLTLQALGIVERQAGKADEALPRLEQALVLLADAGPALRADALEALALTRQDLGRLADAEEGLREVVALREALAAPQPALGQSRDHLALLLLTRGRYPEAGAMLRANLAATPPGDRVAQARRRAHLGRYHHTLGSHARAAAIFGEALALPFDDPELRLALASQLALAELRLGRTEAARRGLEQAAAQARERFRDSGRPFLAAPYLINLGALDLSLGQAAEARAAFAEALELLESSLPPDHPSLIAPLNNLGCAEQAAGDLDRAATHLRRAAALQQKHLPAVHLRVAETARNLARNALLAGDPAAPAEIDRASALGLELLDELIRDGSEQERLNFLQRLDLISLPCATGDPEKIANLLIATKARLLDAMLRPAGSPAAATPDWRAVQAGLPPGSAFIDSCRFTGIDADAEVRYGAIVLLPQGSPKWVPLGSEEDLQRWLAALRQRLDWRARELAGESSRPPALKLHGILRALHRGFWEPLARELPAGTEDLAFSPDGALHFLPLATLLDAGQQPLAARHRQLATVASGRDLLGPAPETRLSDRPWTLLGVSEFPKSPHPPGDAPLLALLADRDPMPGVRDETRKLRSLAPRGSRLLENAAANEPALAAIAPPPAVLHLGCHAFFLPGDRAPDQALDFDEQAGLLHAGGLALHGAALRGPDSALWAADDDLLFPAEVARLPLHGTRLVTLSSCESGAGTAVSGEGLLGLRRGFALAGAREVAVALWPVSDRSTPAFMDRFYRLALASDRPAQALWQCQREFLAAAASEDEFEDAVLRYGPFLLSQNTPLATSNGPIHAPPGRELPWKPLLLALPLAAFLLARISAARSKRQA